MKRALFAAVAVAASLAAEAAPLPFADGNAKTGQALMKKANCDECHSGIVGGNGTGIYKRSDRKVKTASQLLTQVRYCNTQLGTNWFPEDEANVAAYLNATYYHFK